MAGLSKKHQTLAYLLGKHSPVSDLEVCFQLLAAGLVRVFIAMVGSEHVDRFDLLIAVATNELDLDQSLTCFVPFAPMGQANLFACGTPGVRMWIGQRVVGVSEESMLTSV